MLKYLNVKAIALNYQSEIKTSTYNKKDYGNKPV